MSVHRVNEVRMLDDLGKAEFTFETVQDLKNSTEVTVGQKVRTLGYHTAGDGGGNSYTVVAASTSTADGGSYINLTGSGLQAKGLFANTFVIPTQFGARGDNNADDAPSIQKALTFACDNLLNVIFMPKPYLLKSAPNSDLPGLSSAVKSLLYVNAPIQISLNGARLVQRTGANRQHTIIVDPGDEYGGFIANGTIDFQAQAVDDLSSSAVTALPAEYENATYSGYGDEEPNGVFPLVYDLDGTSTQAYAQYAGWPFGETPQPIRSYGIFVINGNGFRTTDLTLIRAKTAAIRTEDSTGVIVNECRCIEPRFTGINISNDSFNCHVFANRVYSSLQIGVSIFAGNNAKSQGHIVTNNTIINLASKPLGENGIAVTATTSVTDVSRCVVNNNRVEQYGSHGIRFIRSLDSSCSNNIIRSTATDPVHEARYPSGGQAIACGIDSERISVTDNIISVAKVGIEYDPSKRHVVENNLMTAISDREFSDYDRVADLRDYLNSGVFTPHVEVVLIRDDTLTVSTIEPGLKQGQRLQFVRVTGGGVVTITNSATIICKGGVDALIDDSTEAIEFVYTGTVWREVSRSLIA